MSDQNNPPRDRVSKLPGGIGCLGILMVLVMIIAAVGMALDSSQSPEGTQGLTARPNNELPSLNNPELQNQIDALAGAQSGPPGTIPSIQGKPLASHTTSPTARPMVTATRPPATKTAPLATASEVPTESAATTPTASRASAEEAVDWPTNTPIPPPLPTPRDSYSWTLKVPILMYHYISEAPEDADKYRRDLSVTAEDFREQMSYLVDNGFESIDLYDLSLAITDKVELPPKPIIITMDDGYRDNYENAFPILEELGLKGTFFLATEFIDKNNENYMDWAMIEEMAAAGHRFEPHSKTHADLTIHDRSFIIWEVQGSRETIAAHVGYLPRYFAYPSGRYNEEVQNIIAELDFWGAVTTLGGIWNGYPDRFEWTRVRIRDVTGLEDFRAMIE